MKPGARLLLAEPKGHVKPALFQGGIGIRRTGRPARIGSPGDSPQPCGGIDEIAWRTVADAL
jgi:hypothetical protein